jgi:hypothetical protein
MSQGEFNMKPDTPEDIKTANEQANLLVEALETDDGFKELGDAAYKEAQRQILDL